MTEDEVRGLAVRTQRLCQRLGERLTEQRGAALVEYGLLVVLIAAVVIVVVTVLGHHVSNDFQSATVGWP